MTTRASLVPSLALLLLPFTPPVQCQVVKRDNTKNSREDTLLQQYETARQSRDWADAKAIVEELVALRPSHWAYRQALGDAELELGQYQEALQSYQTAIQTATDVTDGRPAADSAKARAVGQMLTSEGDAYLKLKRYPEAIAVFTRAAEVSPHPGIAAFNLCVTLYNMGSVDPAVAACDRAIEADSTKADAYFIKGSLLLGKGDIDAQKKFLAPPGTVEALTKYLELAPDGSHASDVRAMLDFIGVKVHTNQPQK
jgi:tetratricopeptide (TPR) repeat protein